MERPDLRQCWECIFSDNALFEEAKQNGKYINYSYDPRLVSLDEAIVAITSIVPLARKYGKLSVLKSAWPSCGKTDTSHLVAYSREELADCIERHVWDDKKAVVLEKVERMLSKEVFGDYLPVHGINQILFREHLEDLY